MQIAALQPTEVTRLEREDIGEAIIRAIGVTQGEIEQGVEGLGALRYPVPHGHQAMVALGQDVTEPDADDGANTGALPPPVRCDMGSKQGAHAHVLMGRVVTS